MRRGEIAALRWKSVDLDAGQLAVVESAEQMNGTVGLNHRRAAARAPLRSPRRSPRNYAPTARQAQELLKLGVRLSDDNFVCAHADGRLMQPTWITHEWVALIIETGLPGYAFTISGTLTRPICSRPASIPSCQRTVGSLQGRHHAGSVLACHAGDAGGCRCAGRRRVAGRHEKAHAEINGSKSGSKARQEADDNRLTL